MKFDALFMGVGGEGALTTSVILARAAGMEGYKVIGTQFHGLAQRGGSIPIHVRFGEDVYSPMIKRGEADIIFALEPIEALRALKYASKEKTKFIIDTFPTIPVYVQILGEKYPSTEKIMDALDPFAKKIVAVDSSNICKEKLGNVIYGDIMILGIAFGEGWLPLKKNSILEAIKQTIPRDIEQNLKAFQIGIDFIKH